MRLWKALGLAGFAGIAATGAILVRDERRRAKLTPEQVRDRLHERVKALPPQTSEASGVVASHRSPSRKRSVGSMRRRLSRHTGS